MIPWEANCNYWSSLSGNTFECDWWLIVSYRHLTVCHSYTPRAPQEIYLKQKSPPKKAAVTPPSCSCTPRPVLGSSSFSESAAIGLGFSPLGMHTFYCLAFPKLNTYHDSAFPSLFQQWAEQGRQRRAPHHRRTPSTSPWSCPARRATEAQTRTASLSSGRLCCPTDTPSEPLRTRAPL